MKISFIVLILSSIVISVILVLVSMYLYAQSGAAQLDLSRPAFESVRAKAQQSERFDGFDAAGPIDSKSLEQFDKLYVGKQEEIQRADGNFDPSVIDNQTLGISVQ